MPHLTVDIAGASSIQGFGHYGGQRYGIAPGGAMDRLALAQANALAGENADAAAIEIGPLPARFTHHGAPVRIALAGAPRDVFLGAQLVALGRTHIVRDGETLTMRGARSGRYTYLACEGALQPRQGASPLRHATPRGMSQLRDGDAIPLVPAQAAAGERAMQFIAYSDAPIRVVLGPQLDYFSPEAIARFLATSWIVSHAADRMAYVLDGGRVPLAKGHNIVSDGTVTGSIQIAGSGQPIVVLCDRGTVGGYPKIATIISADLGRFAQRPQGAPVVFAPVDVREAHAAARHFAESLARMKRRVALLAEPLDVSAAAFAGVNLAGDVVDARLWLADPRAMASEASTGAGT